jgi:hypothetical protein
MPQITYLDEVGKFECVVVQPEGGWFGESKKKGTPFIRVPVSVTEAGSCFGHIAIWQGWLSDACFDRTIARLKKVFGFNGDLSALNSGSVTLVGLPCNIETGDEEFEGEVKLRVKWLNPPGGGGVAKMDEGKVNSLLSRLTSRAKAIAKSTPGATPASKDSTTPTATTPPTASSTPASDGPPPEEDDVPF